MTVEEAVGERFYSWAYVGPIGNAIAAMVWINQVGRGNVPDTALWLWALVAVTACAAMLIPLGVRRARAWKTNLGIPKFSILSLGAMGAAWGSTVWLATDVPSSPTFVFGTAAVLFSITAGTFVGNTGSIYASSALLAPLGLGFATGLFFHGYAVPALGVVAFAALTIPAFIDSARVTQELITLQIESDEVAAHDPLTGLLNRRGLSRSLSECDPSTSMAVLFIDLDGFKGVNDEFGHEVGDAVLQVCARRLARAAEPGRFVGRLGGDEFVVVFSGLAGEYDVDTIRSVAESLIEALGGPMQIGQRSLQISASAGLNFGQRSEYGAGLARRADEAMMTAKRMGGDRVHVVERLEPTCDRSPALRLVGDETSPQSPLEPTLGTFSSAAEAPLLRLHTQ